MDATQGADHRDHQRRLPRRLAVLLEHLLSSDLRRQRDARAARAELGHAYVDQAQKSRTIADVARAAWIAFAVTLFVVAPNRLKPLGIGKLIGDNYLDNSRFYHGARTAPCFQPLIRKPAAGSAGSSKASVAPSANAARLPLLRGLVPTGMRPTWPSDLANRYRLLEFTSRLLTRCEIFHLSWTKCGALFKKLPFLSKNSALIERFQECESVPKACIGEPVFR